MEELRDNPTGRKVAVVGLGPRTGVALVRYLWARGADVTAFDEKPQGELSSVLSALDGVSFRAVSGPLRGADLAAADFILLSPGVPWSHPALAEARRSGVPMWSEVEFAARRLSGALIAVTGSNGKSTTTAMTGHILSSWGKRVFTGGNLGEPLILAADRDLDFIVAEVSSFQLEAVETFRPRAAALLNLSPNHLDRHGTMKAYGDAKARLFANMEGDDLAVLNGEDPFCRDLGKRLAAAVWWFSLSPGADISACREEIRLPGGVLIPIEGFPLRGSHNLSNAAAAAALAFASGCPPDVIASALKTFRALPHRLEPVGDRGGVFFINDSKSTTPLSAVRALESFDRPILWLAGGRAKGADYAPLVDAVRRHVKKSFLYGEAAAAMAQSLEGVPAVTVGTMDEAFARSLTEARTGDVVLLSPANASFDHFRDFEERGERFRELVRRATGGTS